MSSAKWARGAGVALVACLILSLPLLNPTRAAPPLEVFAGQWIVYAWECVANSSGWFPGHADYLRFHGVSTYLIDAVAGNYQATVEMEGTAEWPSGSIDRSLRVRAVQPDGSTAWAPLGNSTSFDYRHSVIVSQDDGMVLSMSGGIALYASYAYADSPYAVSCSFLQDQPSTLSLYFFRDVDAPVGTFVSSWASGPAQVLEHGQLETLTGSRPAILLFHNESSSLPPMWIDLEQLALQYDRETGFLLAMRYRIQSWVNVTRTSQWTMVGDILSTNMYDPRPLFVLGQVVLAVSCLGAVMVMVLVSRWILRGLRGDRASMPVSAVPPDQDS